MTRELKVFYATLEPLRIEAEDEEDALNTALYMVESGEFMLTILNEDQIHKHPEIRNN